ncbi:membralin-like [Acyrthosiphon pisum]|uniref:Membralin n=1 Tax=Acyrthosiphon pisum TaxID=7029 RepID=A0A8R1WZ95_ACYPI|nr:membralin-like [Acyrthosiphon pisum]|eukprot:XP_008180367.2 PREDICTED: membralin-like [Acyrthosiphon pisum]
MSANNNFQFNIRDSMYFRFSTKYMEFFPRNVRRVIEFVILFEAILALYAFINFHIKLAQPVDCLDHVIDIWPKNGILRVEIIQNHERYWVQKGKINKFLTVEDTFESDYRFNNVLYKINDNFSLFNDFIKTSNPEKNEEVDIEPSTEELDENKFRETSTVNNINVEDEKKKPPVTPRRAHSGQCPVSYVESMWGASYFSIYQFTHSNENDNDIYYENYIVEYSLNDENLFLSSEARQGLEIPVMVVTLNPIFNKCFGNSLNRHFLENFIGYDEILYASIKAVAKSEENRGFIRNVITSKHFPIEAKTQKDRASYILSFFIMIIITLVISLYTRLMNYQLFVAFNYLLNRQNGINGEVSLFKCYVSFLGFLGLSSLIWLYFKDVDALLYIMFIVVAAEMYYAVFTHNETTRKHWPKFFFLYLFMFYAYDYRFNGPVQILESYLFMVFYNAFHGILLSPHRTTIRGAANRNSGDDKSAAIAIFEATEPSTQPPGI